MVCRNPWRPASDWFSRVIVFVAVSLRRLLSRRHGVDHAAIGRGGAPRLGAALMLAVVFGQHVFRKSNARRNR